MSQRKWLRRVGTASATWQGDRGNFSGSSLVVLVLALSGLMLTGHWGAALLPTGVLLWGLASRAAASDNRLVRIEWTDVELRSWMVKEGMDFGAEPDQVLAWRAGKDKMEMGTHALEFSQLPPHRVRLPVPDTLHVRKLLAEALASPPTEAPPVPWVSGLDHGALEVLGCEGPMRAPLRPHRRVGAIGIGLAGLAGQGLTWAVLMADFLPTPAPWVLGLAGGLTMLATWLATQRFVTEGTPPPEPITIRVSGPALEIGDHRWLWDDLHAIEGDGPHLRIDAVDHITEFDLSATADERVAGLGDDLRHRLALGRSSQEELAEARAAHAALHDLTQRA